MMTQQEFRPVICGSTIFSVIFVSGVIIIFIFGDNHYKGLGIILATLGFLGGFASVLYYRRKLKELKAHEKQACSRSVLPDSAKTKATGIVDPLMLRAFTDIKFRACDELKEQDQKLEKMNPANPPAQQCDYVVVNSYPASFQSVLL